LLRWRREVALDEPYRHVLEQRPPVSDRNSRSGDDSLDRDEHALGERTVSLQFVNDGRDALIQELDVVAVERPDARGNRRTHVAKRFKR
jgi:hypothetical protein